MEQIYTAFVLCQLTARHNISWEAVFETLELTRIEELDASLPQRKLLYGKQNSTAQQTHEVCTGPARV